MSFTLCQMTDCCQSINWTFTTSSLVLSFFLFQENRSEGNYSSVVLKIDQGRYEVKVYASTEKNIKVYTKTLRDSHYFYVNYIAKQLSFDEKNIQ